MDANQFRSELRQRLERNRDRVLLRIVGTGFNPVYEYTGGDILEKATALAARYAAVDPSRVVLLLLPHSPELFLLHLGLVLEGRLPGILPWPTSRIDAEKYQRNLVHQLRSLPAHQLITLPRLASNLGPFVPFPVTGCRIEGGEEFERHFLEALPLADLQPAEAAADPVLPADPLFLQFSGGTTGTQKAVVVTAPMHGAQLEHMRAALSFDRNDGVASWLPMYHDMGLIACLWFPLWHEAPSLHFSASDWLINPEMLFFYLDRYRATFCWLPNFAFSYLAGRRAEMHGPHSLDHVRGFVNCSEPVRRNSMGRFLEAFAGWGVAPQAPQACYAMAENVFAVTQTSLDRPPATFPRARVRNLRGGQGELSSEVLDDVYVSSGRTLPGAGVRVVNNGQLCGEAEPGEIQLLSDSLFCGYWGPNGFVTTSLSEDGWYSTGDYGFLAEGELFVIGRMKDIVIVGGQNIFPEDVETVVNTVEGIYPGRVVAFGVQDQQYGTESLAVVAELRGAYDEARAGRLQRAIQRLVLTVVGVAPRHVAVVPERWIVKSTAGKISRRDTMNRFTREVLRGPAASRVPAVEAKVREDQHA